MSYTVKEIFYTLQGEGMQAGRPSVFLRFAGCNLWSGREEDRHSAICQFCDTDFVGMDGPEGGRFQTAVELAQAVARQWPGSLRSSERPYVVCTGGEPMLQLDTALVKALHKLGFEVAIETNGTIPVLDEIDWVCVSPKAGAPLVQKRGNELKLVYPQPELPPDSLLALSFEHFLLQPMDGPDIATNTKATVDYCLQNPPWRLSLQTHKFLGLP